MFCSKCGKELIEGARFCAGCGAEIAAVQPEEKPAQIQKISPQEPSPKSPNSSPSPKSPKSKLPIILIIIATAVVLIGAIAAITIFTKKIADKSENVSEVTQVGDEEDNEEEKEKPKRNEKLIDDPLLNNEAVSFVGEMGRDDNETRKLLTKLLSEETSIDPDNIITVCCSDFEKTGDYSAFVFEGEFNGGEDEYAEQYYVGSCYFVSEDVVAELEQPFSECWSTTGEMVDFGKREYFFINEYYTTAGNTQVWTVRNGEPVEDDISRYGYMFKSSNVDCFEIVCSLYDMTYDPEIGSTLGHTWKSYYCDYDEKEDCFIEYGGKEIEITEIESLCNRDFVTELTDEGRFVLNAYVRGNGIVNINYVDTSDYYASFGNVNYDLESGKLITVDEYADNDLDGSNYGGIYDASFTGIKQVLPKDVPQMSQKEVYLTIYEVNSLADVLDYQIIYGFVDTYESYEGAPTNCAFIIDENTKLENVPNDGKSAMEWMRSLSNPTEDMIMMGDTLMGVFGFEVTGSHVDKIFGQYWWD